MKPSQGDVVIGPDFIGGSHKRPFIVVNNENHPFHKEECLVVLVTTTKREEAIELHDEKFKHGSLPKKSYASPWTITTIKNSVIKSKVGELEEEILGKIEQDIETYIKVENS